MGAETFYELRPQSIAVNCAQLHNKLPIKFQNDLKRGTLESNLCSTIEETLFVLSKKTFLKKQIFLEKKKIFKYFKEFILKFVEIKKKKKNF